VNDGLRFGVRTAANCIGTYAGAMQNDRLLVVLSIVVGILLIIVGIVYWVEPARSLPGFFPGHEA